VTGSINVQSSSLAGTFSGSVITNLGDIYTTVAAATKIVTIDSSSYGTLLSGGTADANTLYFISGSTTSVPSASFATSASFASTASFATSASFAATASFFSGSVSQSISSSFATTASFAITASFALNAATAASFPFTGSAQITGSLGVTGSINVQSGSQSGSVVTNVGDSFTDVPFVKQIITLTSSSYASLLPKDPNTLYVISGSSPNVVSASFATSASVATTAISASFASTASFLSGSVASASFATTSSFAITASFALNAGGGGAAFPFTGSAGITGSLIVTGSSRGNIVSMSIASSTASLDMDAGNYFTCLASGNFFVNITNLRPGDTANLVLTTVGIATASFSTNVKQPSGSLYRPTSGSNNTDVLSIVSVDSSNAYLLSAKKFV
jgi:hypothetical protein